jgi:hypothetical protein
MNAEDAEKTRSAPRPLLSLRVLRETSALSAFETNARGQAAVAGAWPAPPSPCDGGGLGIWVGNAPAPLVFRFGENDGQQSDAGPV